MDAEEFVGRRVIAERRYAVINPDTDIPDPNHLVPEGSVGTIRAVADPGNVEGSRMSFHIDWHRPAVWQTKWAIWDAPRSLGGRSSLRFVGHCCAECEADCDEDDYLCGACRAS